MTSQEFQNIAPNMPDGPGVYIFKDTAGQVLYVGKATSLRDRVRSYFGPDLMETRGRKLVDMIALAASIDTAPTDSVLEALILEANLIKFHQPKYNTDEKDNKSWNYVVITKEAFPKVLVKRGRAIALGDQTEYTYVFGPFPYGMQLREAMKIIRRIFPYRDQKCCPANEQRAKAQKNRKTLLPEDWKPRPCFNRQIGLCPGVCTGEMSQIEYAEQIDHLRLFFEGKKKELLDWLEGEMYAHAEREEFEKAGEVRRTIFALTHIQDIALLKRQDRVGDTVGGIQASGSDTGFRIEAYDVAHISGTNIVGVMVVVEDGEPKKSDYRKFRIRLQKGADDTAALKEMLCRRFNHLEWPLPQIVAVDGGQAQINTAEKVLNERGLTISLVAVVKDEHHKPREILGDKNSAELHKNAILLANAEAHRFVLAFHRRRRGKTFLGR